MLSPSLEAQQQHRKPLDNLNKGSNLSLLDSLLHDEQRYLLCLSSLITIYHRLSVISPEDASFSSNSSLTPLKLYLKPASILYEFHQSLYKELTIFGLDSFSRHENTLFRNYKCVWLNDQKFHQSVKNILNDDQVLSHVVATECKLASGEWTSLLEMTSKVLTRLDDYARLLNEYFGATSTSSRLIKSPKDIIQVANALKSINRTKKRLEDYQKQRKTHDSLQKLVVGLERPKIMSLESDQYYVPVRIVNIMPRKSSSGTFGRMETKSATSSITTNIQVSDEEEADQRRVLAHHRVRLDGLWYRMLILTPSSLLFARPRGIFTNITVFFLDQKQIASFEVVEEIENVHSLSLKVDDDDERGWVLPDGRKIQFESAKECSTFLVALQDAIIES